MWDIFIFGDGTVMFNYGDVLVFYCGVLRIMESRALKIDVLMKCWCVFTWWVGPHACILDWVLENGDELVLKSPVTYLWQLGDDRCGTTFI